MEIVTKAYAKLNLTLDVLGRRDDGLHELQMVMQTVSLCDEIKLTIGTGKGLRVKTNLGYLPHDSRNIAAQAAVEFAAAAGIEYEGILIDISKRIPVCAGMGGGSADAAAVLKALNEHYRVGMTADDLCKIGLRLGSDVPFCIVGGTALAEGIGEILTPLPALPHCHIVICKPRFSISTPAVFSKLDCGRIQRRPDTQAVVHAIETGDLNEVARHMYNIFDQVVSAEHREIGELQHIMIENGAIGASMSGTGPSVFGLYDNPEAAKDTVETLRGYNCEVFLSGNIE